MSTFFSAEDGDELIDFAHMAKADVLIAAPSSFSLVAALFNPKCVVTFKDYGSALPDWAQHSNGSLSRQIVAPSEYYRYIFAFHMYT